MTIYRATGDTKPGTDGTNDTKADIGGTLSENDQKIVEMLKKDADE